MKDWLHKPSSISFDDALRKGFGRAYIWPAAGFADAPRLIAACLDDFRFDTQVEEPRGDWLWRIVRASLLCDLIKQSVLDALNAIESSQAACQLCQLARHFAKEGDERFRLQLRRIVDGKPVEDMPWLGEKELILLEKEGGFLLALRRNASDLKSRSWDWFDSVLVDDAKEILGPQRVSDILDSESAKDEAVRRFVRLLSEQESRGESTDSKSPQQTVVDISASDIIEAAESPAKTSVRFRGWGRYAETADLDTVFTRLLQCDRASAIERYLQVFAARPFPRFDSKVLELCEHEDIQVRRRASTAVATNHHPDIRTFAIGKLPDPEYQEYAIEMLIANYERGDETAVLEAIDLPEDQAQRHWVLMSLRKLIESNAESECSQAARLIYDETPCSSCRHSVVKLMSDRSVLPESLRVECQFDVDPDTRSLVGGPAWND